jgi:hypothetical protein
MEKKDKKKIIFIGLGTIATGVLGFFGWQAISNGKEAKKEQAERSAENQKGSQHSSDSTGHKSTYSLPSGGSGSDGFPLKSGSRGAHVKALQLALIAKYGASILPHYGADSDFGNEVAVGLKTAGLPAIIDQSTYNVLVGSSFDSTKAADALYNAANNQDFPSALAALKQINSTDQYTAIDTIFKTNYEFGWVHKTLVNGMLDSFSDDTQKQQIRLEFSRMGLKYDGSKWSLSGIEIRRIITLHDTEVFEKHGRSFNVMAGTILGYPITIKHGWVYFYPLNFHVLLRVKRNSIKIN